MISVEDIVQPKIGVNYLTPRLTNPIAVGTFEPLRYDRPVILVPTSLSTVGTVYVFPGSTPQNNANAIPIPAGNAIVLDGTGLWYVKHSSGSPETFLVMDAGAAGNAAAMLSAMGIVTGTMNVAQIGGIAQTGLDLSGKWAVRVPVTPPAAASVTTASASKLAARVGRKFLYWYANNFAGGCTKVTVSFSTPVVSGRGFIATAGDGSDWKSFDATTGIPETAVYAITDVGTADMYFVEMT